MGIFWRGRWGVLLVVMAFGLGGLAGRSMAQETQMQKKPDGAQQGQLSEQKPTEEKELKPVEVVAPPIREQAERAETVTIITSEEIEKKHAPVTYDALSMQPGLHHSRRLGATASGQSRLIIRGLGSTPVAGLQVLIDGRPDITVTFEHPIPEFHSMENVERIEVIHGPSPVLYGYGNTGVVNIITKEPGPGLTAYVEGSGGSLGTTEDFARVGYGWDRGFVSLSARGLRTDGHIPNTAFWAEDVNLKVGYKLDERWKLTLAGGEGKSFAEVPQPFGAPSNITFDFVLPYGNLALVGRFDRSETSVNVWGNYLDFRRERVAAGRRKTFVWEYGGKFKESLFLFPGNTIILGTDVLFAEAQNTPPGGTTSSGSITEVGPYLFVEQTIITAITVNGGVRMTFNSEFGSEPSPEVGLSFRPARVLPFDFLDGTVLRARATRGFRSPTIGEIFGVFGAGANPDLQPERMWQYELGLNQKVGKWLTFDIVGFLQEGSNRIQQVGTPVQFQNTGKFTHRGLETRAMLHPVEHLTLGAGATILDVQDDFDRGVPLNAFDFGIYYVHSLLTPNDLSISLVGRLVHRYFALDNRFTPARKARLPDYFVADAKVSYRLWKHFRAFVNIDNFTDADYQTVLGIPMPGISAFAGLSYTFF